MTCCSGPFRLGGLSLTSNTDPGTIFNLTSDLHLESCPTTLFGPSWRRMSYCPSRTIDGTWCVSYLCPPTRLNATDLRLSPKRRKILRCPRRCPSCLVRLVLLFSANIRRVNHIEFGDVTENLLKSSLISALSDSKILPYFRSLSVSQFSISFQKPSGNNECR